MLIRETDGQAIYHDGFAVSSRMTAVMFHRLYVPVEEYGKRPSRKKKQAALLAALKTDGPLPGAAELAKRGKKVKAPRQPPTVQGFFV
jgi:hypothetical protein